MTDLTISIPDELAEQIKSYISSSQAEIEKFFVEAARKQLREIRAKQMEDEYRKAHSRRSPREVYETTLNEILAFEAKYKMPSDRFLRDFESGAIDEDPNDWLAFYHWRSLCYGLKHMEEQYGFKRELSL